jgi:hypothetical protein
LGCGTNKDYMGNKNLVLSSMEQTMTKKGIKFWVEEQIKTTWGTKIYSAKKIMTIKKNISIRGTNSDYRRNNLFYLTTNQDLKGNTKLVYDTMTKKERKISPGTKHN